MSGMGASSAAGAPAQPAQVSYSELMDALGGMNAFNKLLNLDEESMEAKRLQFQQDTQLMNARLGNMYSYLLNPNSQFVQYWDLTTSVCLVFTTFVTPFEVGMNLETKVDGLFIVNQIVNSFFIIDIFVQFFLPTKGKDGELMRKHKAIACKYLKGWFGLDVVSVLPLDVLQVSGVLSGGNPSLVRGFRLLRILRLIKLIRIVRASRIVTRWENSIAISFTSRAAASWSIFAVVLMHWFACAWSLLPQLMIPWRGSHDEELEDRVVAQINANASCTGCVSTEEGNPWCDSDCLSPCEREQMAQIYNVSERYVYFTMDWICRAVEDGFLPDNPDVGSQYMASLFVGLLLLVGGTSTIFPSNSGEFALMFMAVLGGTILFAAIQARRLLAPPLRRRTPRCLGPYAPARCIPHCSTFVPRKSRTRTHARTKASKHAPARHARHARTHGTHGTHPPTHTRLHRTTERPNDRPTSARYDRATSTCRAALNVFPPPLPRE